MSAGSVPVYAKVNKARKQLQKPAVSTDHPAETPSLGEAGDQSHCWFWQNASREEVNLAFRRQPDGTFVVRTSSSEGNYTLTIRKGGNNRLIRIYHNNGRFGFAEPLRFHRIADIIALCKYQSLVKYNKDLDIVLKYPLARLTKVAGPNLGQYESLYMQADPTRKGAIPANEAAVFLKKSSLPDKVLSQIWDLADPSGRGYLDKHGFFVALKLVALGQNGKDVSMANINMQVPSPLMGGGSAQAMAPLGSMGTTWAIQMHEKTKYDEIFDGLKPTNGLLSGDKVKPVLINSKLPIDILGRVWDLSDMDKDGFLDREEFAVAMHLVYKALEKEPVPMTLPPDLIPPGKRVKKALTTSAVLGDILAPPPMSPGLKAAPLGATVTAELPAAVPFPTDFSTAPAALAAPATGGGGPAWVVTPMDKLKYDEMFKKADTDLDGYVNGQEIKEIFLNSGVAQNVLAHIWNLCDTQGIGKLNSDQFALAMYLIQEKLVRGSDPPPQLTPEMMPPSLRPAAGNVDESSGMVTDFNTSGMKELDGISKEIEEIKREKILLEQDKAQKEADLRIRGGELQALQKELDTILITVKQLEGQKGEAQKRLDELDDKRSKVESQSRELQEKCNEQQGEIDQLRSQIMSSEMSTKKRDEELQKMRDELNVLRQEELELEQKVETGNTQLNNLGKTLEDTQTEISMTKQRVSRLQDTQNRINQCINEYNSLISGDTNTVEPDLAFLNEVNNDPVSSSKPLQRGFSKDPFKSDPFKDDPFKNSSDPFKGADDPFSSSKNTQPSAFNKVSQKSAFDDAFGSFPTSSQQNNDPFGGSDPFASAFDSSSKSNSDPFSSAFGGVGANDLKSPVNPDDPFGTGSFTTQQKAAKSLNISFPTKREKSPAPSLPPKQKKAPPPPRPPPVKSASPAGRKKDTSGDLWGGHDPFAPSPVNTAAGQNNSTDLFANFDNFGGSATTGSTKSSGNVTEADQLAWATKNSQDDWERERRLQEQEKADLELAIQLSKQS